MGITYNKYIIKKIENNTLLKLLTCIILSSFVIFFFLLINKIIDNNKFKKYTVKNDINLINEIEQININNGILQLEGYAFYLDHNSKNNIISLFLKNLKNNDEVWMETENILRPDIQNYYNCEFNYENSGFIATTKLKNLIKEDSYEIFINLDKVSDDGKVSRVTVSTNRYIYNGNLLSYNPYDFDYPNQNTHSEFLQKIFNDGKLHYYNNDIGIYIYEYQKKLYWIATEKFPFNENGNTCIPYQIWTTQKNLLPDYRRKYEFDNLDFYFENFELKDENTKPYRVAVYDLPTSYAITHILTGVYNVNEDKWIWAAKFQVGKYRN